MKKRKSNKKLLDVAKFLVKFNLFAIPLYIVLFLDINSAWMQGAVANVSYSILAWMGFNPTADGLLISIPVQNGNWAAFINFDCTGWKSVLAFFALVMSTGFSPRRKIAGLMLVPVIFAVNMARIIFMFFYVRTFDLAHYATVHTVIWSWGLIIAITALWLFWVKYESLEVPSWKTINTALHK